MMQTGRKYYATDSYRYGFNGKENDNEIKGEGNQQDYGMRIYDPRLGKFLSVDPLTRGYPWYTPYQFAGNKPIWAIDLDGLEESMPKQLPTTPQLIVSECINCEQKYKLLWKLKLDTELEQLKKEYEVWRSNPDNFAKPTPAKFQNVAKMPASETIKQGAIAGSEEFKIFKANADQLYTLSQYAPVTGDLHDIKDIVTNVSKGDFAAAGLSAVFLIPGSDFLKPVKSLVKTDKQLLKFARETFEGNKALSKEASDLVDKYRKGLDGGIGGHEVFKGVSELRGKSGARVYYRETKDGMEVLGYSNKNNQQEVINRLKKVYEKKN